MTPETQSAADRLRTAIRNFPKADSGTLVRMFPEAVADIEKLLAELERYKNPLPGDLEQQAAAWVAVHKELETAGLLEFWGSGPQCSRDRCCEFIRHLAAELDAGPKWIERPSCAGIWLTCECNQYRFHRVQDQDISEWTGGECYGPILKAANDDFIHVSAREAFAALREASGGRWDNVDPEEFVRESRRDDVLPLPPAPEQESE